MLAVTACAAPSPPPAPDGFVVFEGAEVHGLATDGTTLFWTTIDGSVMEAPLDGSSAPRALASGITTRPASITLVGTTVYWTDLGSEPDPNNGDVMSFDLTTQQGKAISSPAFTPEWITANTTTACWVEANDAVDCAAASSPPKVLFSSGAFLIETGSLALDSTNVYFARQHPFEVPLSGGEPVDLAPAAPAGGGTLAIQGQNLYWTVGAQACDTPPCPTSDPGWVMTESLAGGAPVELAQFTAKYRSLPLIAVDADYVYWTVPEQIRRVPIGGGAVETVASNQGRFYALLLTDTDVYWSTDAPSGAPAGIRTVPK